MTRRAVILKPCCLGDVLLATPLAASLRAGWPEAQLHWAVGRHSRPVLCGNPHLDELIDATGCVRGDYRPLALARLVWTLRRRRYDAAFVPDRSPVLALAVWLARVPQRVGLDSAGRGRLNTVRVPVPPDRHEAELYLDLARALDLPVGPPRPVFVPSTDDRTTARAVLAELPAHAPIVAIHPGGGVNPGMRLPAKRWPPARFATLADRCAARLDARVVLLGGPGDAAAVAAVRAAAAASCLDLAGQLTLGQVAAVVERCRLYVGNDSGVAHLAAAVGTPPVVVFGPTRPERYGPPPGLGRAVAPPGGAVDRLTDAAGSTAVRRVTVDQVWAAVAALWSSVSGRPHEERAVRR